MAPLGHDPAPRGAPGPDGPWPRPARLSVGVVSAGRVGTALGAALERAGHVVAACSAVSDASLARARARLPESRILPVPDVAAGAELLILAVPDTELAGLADGLAAAVDRWQGRIVVHTSGANGTAVLAPLAARGAACLAIHPAMTFTGDPADTDRLGSACFGVTADDEVGLAIAQSLVLEIGGEPVVIPEDARTLYHAALAHGSNHLVTLVRDAADALRAALAPAAGEPADGTITGEPGAAERILAPLLGAALDNALRHGDRALTGPVARGDADAVAAHRRVLAAADPALAEAYRTMALRTAVRSGAPAPLVAALSVPDGPAADRPAAGDAPAHHDQEHTR